MSVNLSWLLNPFFADPAIQPTSIVVAVLLLYWALVDWVLLSWVLVNLVPVWTVLYLCSAA